MFIHSYVWVNVNINNIIEWLNCDINDPLYQYISDEVINIAKEAVKDKYAYEEEEPAAY